MNRQKRIDTNFHAKQRALERYGINLTSRNRYKIIQQIQNQKAEFVEKQSHTRSIFIVDFEGQKIKVVYDKNNKKLRKNLQK